MKKIFVYMASAALVFAASCNKIEEANTPVDTPAETELITVELNPQTKTSLDGKSTVWTAGDKVNVTVGEEVIGTLTLVSGSTFKGEITAGLEGGTSVTLNYPVDEDGKTVTTVPATQTAAAGSFAQGAALLEGTTTVADLRAKKGATLANTTALLQFSVAQAGDVTFEVGTTKYTVTGCKTGETYYACVAPATAAFTARIDGYLSKKAAKNVTFTANKIANLGALPAPEASGWYVQGLDNWQKSAPMYKEGNWSVAYNVTSSTKSFKFNSGSEWIGGKSAENVIIKDYAYPTGGNNIQVKDANTAYDFYFCKEGAIFMILPAGSPIDEIYVETDMYIRGNFTKAGYGWDKGFKPTIYDGKYFAWKNLQFDSAPEFKFITTETGWDGYQYTKNGALTISTWTTLKNYGGNTTYSTKGTYDIYTTSDGLNRNKVLIVKAGDPVPAFKED